MRWSLEREPHLVGWPDLLDAVRRAPSRPQLAVFNVCDSTNAIALLSDGLTRVITCDGQVGDDAALLFTRVLYRHLGSRTVADSFAEAQASVRTAYPDQTDMYRLTEA